MRDLLTWMREKKMDATTRATFHTHWIYLDKPICAISDFSDERTNGVDMPTDSASIETHRVSQ